MKYLKIFFGMLAGIGAILAFLAFCVWLGKYHTGYVLCAVLVGVASAITSIIWLIDNHYL